MHFQQQLLRLMSIFRTPAISATFSQLLKKHINKFSFLSCSRFKMDQTPLKQTDDKKFSYFAYGSNLLAARIHLMNPSAVFQATARLDNYRLEFDFGGSSTWRGAAATVSPSPGHHVWGVVWSMNLVDLPSLDIQEGVAEGVYEPFKVIVIPQDGQPIECRTYNLLMRGSEDRRPSPQYLDVIVQGAVEHQLPQEYIDKLKTIEHNSFPGPVPLYDTVMTRHRSHSASNVK